MNPKVVNLMFFLLLLAFLLYISKKKESFKQSKDTQPPFDIKKTILENTHDIAKHFILTH